MLFRWKNDISLRQIYPSYLCYLNKKSDIYNFFGNRVFELMLHNNERIKTLNKTSKTAWVFNSNFSFKICLYYRNNLLYNFIHLKNKNKNGVQWRSEPTLYHQRRSHQPAAPGSHQPVTGRCSNFRKDQESNQFAVNWQSTWRRLHPSWDLQRRGHGLVEKLHHLFELIWDQGKRSQDLKMPQSSTCTSEREIDRPATTTVEFPFSPSQGRR